jgi:hypothetical protein
MAIIGKYSGNSLLLIERRVTQCATDMDIRHRYYYNKRGMNIPRDRGCIDCVARMHAVASNAVSIE